MRKLIVITGGARSGKSTFAEKIAGDLNKKVLYLASAIPFDEGMKDRIKKHQDQRPKEWKTIEAYHDFEGLAEDEDFKEAEVVLFDCLTVMVTNNMLDREIDYDTCSMAQLAKIEGDISLQVEDLLGVCQDKILIVVTNEVGMGIVPSYKLGSYFRDIAGRMNQLVAARANEVYLAVAGIPVKIK